MRENSAVSFDGNFDAYLEKKKSVQDAADAEKAAQKEELDRQNREQSKQKQYRTKEQRAQDAKRKLQIKELEKEIELLEEKISLLEEEISSPETASDYALMSEKCLKLEECKNLLNEKMDLWAELG